MSSFEPKNELEYFCISALASKLGQIIKIMAHYHANFSFFFDLTYFREVGQKCGNILVHFLVQIKTSKSDLEINWPLKGIQDKNSVALILID